MIKIKNFFENLYDKIRIKKAKLSEIIKYEDKRRRQIWKKVTLNSTQVKQIDTLYLNNYGKKIPYIWHRHYTAFNSFDPNFFPELLYVPSFERFMNIEREYCKVIADKNILPIIANNASVKIPAMILSSVHGIFRDNNYHEITKQSAGDILRNIGEVFIKQTIETSSGKGCMLVNFIDGIDQYSKRSLDEIINILGNNFIVQEKIICQKDISKIYPDSVNTFRIITYRWKDKYYHMPVIMRIGRGGKVIDNAHAGGIFIGVDDDGFLKKFAFTEFCDRFHKHPDTGVKFEGYKINNYKEMITAAIKMCEMLPQLGCVNWDFTIDLEGNPVLIEANLKAGSIWLIEMAHGCGPFGDLTPEILQWIKKMEHTNKKDYHLYRFGGNQK